ncbi:hypothetical protein D3C85_1014280 [compost metagenome]
MAAEAPLPDHRLGLGHVLLPVLPGLAVEGITLGQQRHHFLAGQVEPVAVTRQCLVLQRRPLAQMEVDQALPLLRRAPLQGDPRTGVAAAAHLLGLVVDGFNRVEPTLQGVAHTLGFARCQALGIGQVLDHRATVFVTDLQVVHGLHARNAHQPAFRGLALVADAAQGILALGRMTALAGLLEDGLRVTGLGLALHRMQDQGCGNCQQATAQAECSLHQRLTSHGTYSYRFHVTAFFIDFAGRLRLDQARLRPVNHL